MVTRVPGVLEPKVSSGGEWRAFVPRHWKGLLAAVVVGVVIVVVKLWPGGLAAERRALVKMRPEERRALYQETFRNAGALCAQAQREPALLDRCQGSVAFLLAFPECDAECRAFADAHRRGPTR